MVASVRQACMRDKDVDKQHYGGVSWFLVHFLRLLCVQHFHVFVHGSFTKHCVCSVDKPREILRTPAFLAVMTHYLALQASRRHIMGDTNGFRVARYLI